MKFDEKNLEHLRRLKREIERNLSAGRIVDFTRYSVVGARIVNGELEVRLVHGYTRWYPVRPSMVVDGGGDPLLWRIRRYL